MHDERIVEPQRVEAVRRRDGVANEILVTFRHCRPRGVGLGANRGVEAVDVVVLAVDLEDEPITEDEVNPTDTRYLDLRGQVDPEHAEPQPQQRLESAVRVPPREVGEPTVHCRKPAPDSGERSPCEESLPHRRLERDEELLLAAASEQLHERIVEARHSTTRRGCRPVSDADASVVSPPSPGRRHGDVRAPRLAQGPEARGAHATETTEQAAVTDRRLHVVRKVGHGVDALPHPGHLPRANREAERIRVDAELDELRGASHSPEGEAVSANRSGWNWHAGSMTRSTLPGRRDAATVETVAWTPYVEDESNLRAWWVHESHDDSYATPARVGAPAESACNSRMASLVRHAAQT